MAAAAPLPPVALAPPGGGVGRAAAGPGGAARAEGAEGLFVVLGAGLAAASHPLLYVKLLVQVGHEPLPPTVGRNVLGRKVLYLPGFFTYARHIVEVDGKRGLFRGLTPRLISSTLSTITRGSVKKAFPLEDMEHVSNKDDVKTSLRKVVKETSHEMMMQCVSRVVSHPLHVISMRCMVQFVGREVKYRCSCSLAECRHNAPWVEKQQQSRAARCIAGWWLQNACKAAQDRDGATPAHLQLFSFLGSGVFSAIGRIFKEEGILGFFVGLVPHILGDVIFLWCCNLLAHFINTYAVDDNFSQASVIRSYTKFVMGIAVSMLTYPFLLVGDLMAVNNCGLRAGLPPYAPAFPSWIHCWRYLSAQGQLFRGSSLLFRRAPVPAACFPID
ncbi:mitochondrial carrier homolog 1 isoform X1 [Falco cherrug]|uniref:mitochondrial carrier homolog 1 isoform X1 n=1 Tax=Falco cherrug TaxID=345164 RepID=UPI002479516F|nr:mitochondrial carrier homolog 1 isoform X1 [Falco cherrug]